MAAKARGGRPKKYENKRGCLTIRLRGEVRAIIEEDARQNGRSLSEQIEFVLERNFGRDRIAQDVPKGPYMQNGPYVTRQGVVEIVRRELGVPLTASRLMKDCALGRGPKPAAIFGKQHLYFEADALAYGKSLVRAVEEHGEDSAGRS